MKNKLLFLLFILIASQAASQTDYRNFIIVTFDGLRWQEIFMGVDSTLLFNNKYTKDQQELIDLYWDTSFTSRRKKLFPFVWGRLANEGQIFGNQNLGNLMNVSNPYHFSYPGYNEIFTGYPDPAINSNNKISNPNVNVLEFLNRQPGYIGKVAAFSSWDVFPYILNQERSGIYVNADNDSLPNSNEEFRLINNLQNLTSEPLGLRPDIFTYASAKCYLKAFHPKILYIAFDETDDFAHAGMYDQYIKSAHAEDAMLKDLWDYIQKDPFYSGKTFLLITCDHGRGSHNLWCEHGKYVLGSSAIWMGIMGPGIPALGERREHAQYYQSQIASTISELLGFSFITTHPIAKSMYFVIMR